jgi:hypothetical protein
MPSVITSRAIVRAALKSLLARPFADDVAIRHHTDQPIIFPDRDAADIVSLHQFRDFGDGSIGADPIDSLMHYVLDSHGGPPLQHSPLSFNYTTDQQRPHERIDGSRSLRAD